MAVLDRLLNEAHSNRWMRYFTVFTRIALAFGFITAGMVKILGERFASGLSVNHPMGHYLEAVSQTGYYYTFIGIAQVLAALLLIIPRTALIGALLYFPIIVNICILSLAVRFEGSLITSPLMVLANCYLLFWDFDRLKYIMVPRLPSYRKLNNRFPWQFFLAGLFLVAAVVLTLTFAYDIMPRNNLSDCEAQCKTSKNPAGCKIFCEGIHQKGETLDKALERYQHAVSH